MRARIVACVLLLTGAVSGAAPCLAWATQATPAHTCCTPLHCHDAMAEPMADGMAMPATPAVAHTSAAAPSQARGIPRCCTSDRDASQPQTPKTIVASTDSSADLQSARVPLYAVATSLPHPLRDPVPLAPSSTARHVLLSVFIV